MGLTGQHAQAWKFLRLQVSKVQDPILRNSMMADIRLRALNEWGFDPDSGRLATDDDVVLSDWEKDFVADIQSTAQYELDVRGEKRDAVLREARGRMRLFIENGGTLADIPADVRTPFIQQLFYDALLAYDDELMEAYDDVSNR